MSDPLGAAHYLEEMTNISHPGASAAKDPNSKWALLLAEVLKRTGVRITGLVLLLVGATLMQVAFEQLMEPEKTIDPGDAWSAGLGAMVAGFLTLFIVGVVVTLGLVAMKTTAMVWPGVRVVLIVAAPPFLYAISRALEAALWWVDQPWLVLPGMFLVVLGVFLSTGFFAKLLEVLKQTLDN